MHDFPSVYALSAGESNGNQDYLGLWLSALDGNNNIRLYENGTLVASFNEPVLDAFLSKTSSGYLSNPNTGANSGQRYAYLNFIGTNGTVFNQVDFVNASLGTGLEFDNVSVLATPLATPYTGTVVPNGTTPAVPEPVTGVLVVMALGLMRRCDRNRT